METTFKINEKFKNLINPPTDEEKQILEEAIVKDGVRHPLTVWKEENTLIDGHTRLEICQRLNLEYPIEYMSFPDEEHAVAWMANNQLGRRNITGAQSSYLRGLRYNKESNFKGAPVGNINNRKVKGEDTAPLTFSKDKTAEKIAQETGVSSRTIYTDANYTNAVDILAETISPEIKTELLSGKVKISKQVLNDIALVARSNPEHAKELYEEAKMGKKKEKNNVVQLVPKPELVPTEPTQKETLPENQIFTPEPCPVCGHIDGTKDMFSGGEYEHEQKWTNELRDKKPLTDALQIAVAAIYRIKAIREDDPDKLEAWARVSEWLESAKADHEAGRKQPKLRRR